MIELLLTITVIGLIAYLLTTLVPMPQAVRTIIIVAVVLFCLLLMLRTFNLDYPVPRR